MRMPAAKLRDLAARAPGRAGARRRLAAVSWDAVLAFPTARVGLRMAGGAVAEIRYLPPDTPLVPARGEAARHAAAALERYRTDPEAAFELPLADAGSRFQRRLRAALRRIPAGRVRSYGDLAAELVSSARAVGQACGANPLPIVVPCHRVVAARGLGGFAHAREGWLIDTKRWLLRHEGAIA